MIGDVGELPAGWALTTLGAVTEPSRERIEPGGASESAYLGLEHIEGGSNRILGIGHSSEVRSTKSVFRRGDVLYGKLRPYLRKVCRPDFAGVCSTDILVFPSSPAVDNGYLFHFLSQQSTADFATQNANGINLPRINSRTLGEIQFPLPPIAEQRRIAAKVDVLRDRTRRAREEMAEVGSLLERLRRSLLAAAFRGDLTAEWRERHPDTEPASELLARIRNDRRRQWEREVLARCEAKGKKPPVGWREEYEPLPPADESELPELPESWCWATASEIVDPGTDIVYGIVQPGPPLSEGVPYVRGLDIQDSRIQTRQLWKTSPSIAERYKRSQLRPGDVLLGIIRHLKVAVVPPELDGANMGRATARLRPSEAVQTDYLAGWLASPFAQGWLFKQYRGGTDMPIVNIADVCRLPVALPPLMEQKQIARSVDLSRLSCGTLQDAVSGALADLARLDQRILSKAFRGELVAQDPADEPASALLERIRSASESAGCTPSRSRRPRRTKA